MPAWALPVSCQCFANVLIAKAVAMVTLPELGAPKDIRGGRSVHEGYQRGWGLQFHDLKAQILADPLYQRAAAAGAGTLMTEEKRMNLFLLITRYFDRLDSRNIIEFGAYKGGNALFMACLLKACFAGAKVFALDTYEGMPPTDAAYDMHGAGDFNDASMADIASRRDRLGLDNLILVKGLFEDTFPSLQAERFGLAHIDCDIYHPAVYCQNAVWPQMADGGYIVFDDADVSSCIGATEAAERLIMTRRIHSEQVWPHWVFRTFQRNEPSMLSADRGFSARTGKTVSQGLK
jgi:predicted O-methyltransferase YrrM